MDYRKDECMWNEMLRLEPEDFGQHTFDYYVSLGYDPAEVTRLIDILTDDSME